MSPLLYPLSYGPARRRVTLTEIARVVNPKSSSRSSSGFRRSRSITIKWLHLAGNWFLVNDWWAGSGAAPGCPTMFIWVNNYLNWNKHPNTIHFGSIDELNCIQPVINQGTLTMGLFFICRGFILSYRYSTFSKPDDMPNSFAARVARH